MHRFSLLVVPACVLCSTIAHAQQFQDGTSARFPAQSLYSNQLSFCDVDQDGDLDIAFADGQGYSSQGAALRRGSISTTAMVSSSMNRKPGCRSSVGIAVSSSATSIVTATGTWSSPTTSTRRPCCSSTMETASSVTTSIVCRPPAFRRRGASSPTSTTTVTLISSSATAAPAVDSDRTAGRCSI